MNCLQVEKLLGEYLDHRLEQNRAGELAAHLARCPACREKLTALQATLERLKSSPPAIPPAGFIERTQLAVHKRVKLPTPSPWRTLRWLAPAAALLVVSLMAWGPYRQREKSRAYYPPQSLLMEQTQPPVRVESAPSPKLSYAAPKTRKEPQVEQVPGLVARKIIPKEWNEASPPPSQPALPALREKGTGFKKDNSLTAGEQEETKPKTVSPPATGLSGPSGQLNTPTPSASPGSSEGSSALPKNVLRRSAEAAQAPYKADARELSGTRSFDADRNPGALAVAGPSLGLKVKLSPDNSGAQAVLIQASVAERGKLTISPAAAPEKNHLDSLSGEGPFSLDQPRNITPSGKPVIWEITRRQPSSLDQGETGAIAGGASVEEKRYLLLVPSRLKEHAKISADFEGRAPTAALSEISEKAGIIILAPAGLRGAIHFTGGQVEPTQLLRLVAGQLALRYSEQGLVHRLE
jgi:hypothetical protein